MMHVDYYTSMDPDDLVKCPYNEAHVLKGRNLQKHMIKCKMTYPRANLKRCPYNACHEVPENLFLVHIQRCPDRVLVDKDIRISGHADPEGTTGNLSLPKYDVNRFNFSDEECWDDDDQDARANYQELPQPKTVSKLLRNGPLPSQSARPRSPPVYYAQPPPVPNYLPEWSQPKRQTLEQASPQKARKNPQADESKIQDRLSDISKQFKQIVALENRQGDGERLNPDEIQLMSRRAAIRRQMDCLGLS